MRRTAQISRNPSETSEVRGTEGGNEFTPFTLVPGEPRSTNVGPTTPSCGSTWMWPRKMMLAGLFSMSSWLTTKHAQFVELEGFCLLHVVLKASFILSIPATALLPIALPLGLFPAPASCTLKCRPHERALGLSELCEAPSLAYDGPMHPLLSQTSKPRSRTSFQLKESC